MYTADTLLPINIHSIWPIFDNWSPVGKRDFYEIGAAFSDVDDFVKLSNSGEFKLLKLTSLYRSDFV